MLKGCDEVLGGVEKNSMLAPPQGEKIKSSSNVNLQLIEIFFCSYIIQSIPFHPFMYMYAKCHIFEWFGLCEF